MPLHPCGEGNVSIVEAALKKSGKQSMTDTFNDRCGSGVTKKLIIAIHDDGSHSVIPTLIESWETTRIPKTRG